MRYENVTVHNTPLTQIANKQRLLVSQSVRGLSLSLSAHSTDDAVLLPLGDGGITRPLKRGLGYVKTQKTGMSRMNCFSHPVAVQTAVSSYNLGSLSALTKPQSSCLRLTFNQGILNNF